MTSYRGHYSKRAVLEGQYSRGTTRSLMHPYQYVLVPLLCTNLISSKHIFIKKLINISMVIRMKEIS